MKNIIFIFIIIWAQSSYGQKKVNLLEEDEEIKSILGSNLLPTSYPDSIVFHSFYIKITPIKNKETKIIYISTSLGKQVFGNVDSLFRKVDFNKFIKGTKQKHIIIPVGILIYAHKNIKPNDKLDIWGLKEAIPGMMADKDKDRYKSIFLTTFFAYVGTLASY